MIRTFLPAVFVMASGLAQAGDSINTTFFGNKAIEGYDPVAYFQENKAVEGRKGIKLEWMGANWHFSSTENRDSFLAEPERYAPQFGGYCAYAVSQNSTAGIDPEQFSIVNGKLYLNYNAKIQNKWLMKRDEYIEQANEFWPAVVE